MPRSGTKRQPKRPSPATMRLRALSRIDAGVDKSTISTDEYRELLMHAESEDQYRIRARNHARHYGFVRQYHTHNSKRSDPGFPDEVWLNPATGRMLHFEFKRIDGQPTIYQTLWLDDLWCSGYEAACWWPDEEPLLLWWLRHPHPVEQACLSHIFAWIDSAGKRNYQRLDDPRYQAIECPGWSR
jgi:hypothetical protein